MSIKKGIYKYNTGEKDLNGNEIFDDIYFKTFANLVEEDENHRFTSDKEKGIWNGKASTAVATQTANGLMSATDKKKLDGVEAGANAYVHPLSHTATMILVDDTHQFVTTTEKGTWNGKASTATVTQTANGLMSASDKKKLEGIEVGANAYVHPFSHVATMIDQDTNHKFVTDAQIALWNKSGVESMYGNSTTTAYWIKYTNGRLEQGGWIDMTVHPESGSADELITFPVAFAGDVKSVRVTANAWPIANYDDWKPGLQSGISSATNLASARIILLWIGDKNKNYTARCWWEAKGWWK